MITFYHGGASCVNGDDNGIDPLTLLKEVDEIMYLEHGKDTSVVYNKAVIITTNNTQRY